MKRILFFLTILMMAVMTTFAQNRQMSYQAVVRNSANELVVNSAVTVKITIADNAAGTNPYFVENHNVTTNRNGLVSLLIGSGTVESGSFDAVDWSNAYVRSEFGLPGGATVVSTVPVTSVPYALYADHVAYADSVDENSPVITNIYQALADTAQKLRNEIVTPPSVDLSEYAKKDTLANFATNAHLNDTLAEYLKAADATIPNNGHLYLQQNGTQIGVFAADTAENITVNIDLSDYVREEDFEGLLSEYDFATNEHLNDTLSEYLKAADLDLSEYAKKDTLANFATNAHLNDTLAEYLKAADATIPNNGHLYLQQNGTQIGVFAADTAENITVNIDLSDYVREEDFEGLLSEYDLATNEHLNDTLQHYVMEEDFTALLEEYDLATNEHLNDTLSEYLKAADLDLSEYAKKDTLANFATNAHLNDTLAEYLKAADAITPNNGRITFKQGNNTLGVVAVDTANNYDIEIPVAEDVDLSEYAKKDTLANFATNAHLNDTLAEYIKEEDLEGLLSEYEFATLEKVLSDSTDLASHMADSTAAVRSALADTAAAIRSALADTAAAIRAAIVAPEYGTLTITQGADNILGTFTSNADNTIDIPAVDLDGYVTVERLVADSLALLDTANKLKARALDTLNKYRALYNQAMATAAMLGMQVAKNTQAIKDTAAAIRADIVAPNDATLTINYGDSTLGTFTANAVNNATISIPVPEAQEVNDGKLVFMQDNEELGVFTANSTDTIEIEIPNAANNGHLTIKRGDETVLVFAADTADDMEFNIARTITHQEMLDTLLHFIQETNVSEVEQMLTELKENTDVKDYLRDTIIGYIKAHRDYAVQVLQHYISTLTNDEVDAFIASLPDGVQQHVQERIVDYILNHRSDVMSAGKRFVQATTTQELDSILAAIPADIKSALVNKAITYANNHRSEMLQAAANFIGNTTSAEVDDIIAAIPAEVKTALKNRAISYINNHRSEVLDVVNQFIANATTAEFDSAVSRLTPAMKEHIKSYLKDRVVNYIQNLSRTEANEFIAAIPADVKTALKNRVEDTIVARMHDSIDVYKGKVYDAVNSQFNGLDLNTNRSASENMALLKQAVEDTVAARMKDSLAVYKAKIGIEVSNRYKATAGQTSFTIQSPTKILSASGATQNYRAKMYVNGMLVADSTPWLYAAGGLDGLTIGTVSTSTVFGVTRYTATVTYDKTKCGGADIPADATVVIYFYTAAPSN